MAKKRHMQGGLEVIAYGLSQDIINAAIDLGFEGYPEDRVIPVDRYEYVLANAMRDLAHYALQGDTDR